MIAYTIPNLTTERISNIQTKIYCAIYLTRNFFNEYIIQEFIAPLSIALLSVKVTGIHIVLNVQLYISKKTINPASAF